MEKLENLDNKGAKPEKNKFLSWLTEDDSPEIGIAVKEPLPQYLQGVVYEFKKIDWPTKEEVAREFVNVLVIVTIIAAMIYVLDIAFERFFDLFKGVVAK